ncbi:sugar isomerase domain-containing protein [Vallitalea maricola]|uniref:Sugar isomerase domain-containing protein n=1 Tax=Vallitalea maricola TaxID=3074433 RepID=A0ACB5UIC2_9FIRM|nr:sugar isomerase domain-containing protein [Vallitalea sp. AN17-2]
MLRERFYDEMKKVLDKIEKTQGETIDKCAKVIGDSLVNNGICHILDTGHMLMYEGVGRTGGMMAIRPIRINFEVNNPARKRLIPGKENVYYDSIEGFPEFILGKANVAKGDVLIIGSVSGYNNMPVQLALKAREMGVKTIGITSVAYSSKIKAKHKSGKRLFEACDYVLDNCGIFGDAMVEVEELGKKIGPSSGIAASYLMWALQTTVVEYLISIGKEPSVYISNHLNNASAINGSAWENYEKFGY